jgi:hypothetical protein
MASILNAVRSRLKTKPTNYTDAYYAPLNSMNKDVLRVQMTLTSVLYRFFASNESLDTVSNVVKDIAGVELQLDWLDKLRKGQLGKAIDGFTSMIACADKKSSNRTSCKSMAEKLADAVTKYRNNKRHTEALRYLVDSLVCAILYRIGKYSDKNFLDGQYHCKYQWNFQRAPGFGKGGAPAGAPAGAPSASASKSPKNKKQGNAAAQAAPPPDPSPDAAKQGGGGYSAPVPDWMAYWNFAQQQRQK